MTFSSHEALDRLAVTDMIVRERAARDAGLWSDMGAFYHPGSTVDISWFTGSGTQFTAATREAAGGPLYTFHQMGASAVTILADRALVDSNCTVHAFTAIDGVEVDVVSYCRLQWRAQRDGAHWLIAGLRSIYIRDVLAAVNPRQVPDLDLALLAGFRPSYRHIAYLAGKSGSTVRNDLPGVDRPETIAVLRVGEQKWLAQGGTVP
ncbi:nuclear transport factor 2 family protein [Sphingomonas sp. PAMC 26621]|uniref:nuclear transport factor 2 family protein n=1 Tax=Sphingomonas sp. PAMC 26621 TaxID=1112213 RepID=UPI0002892B5B|nr:nuclear transport factor 2 family protein [Sphingomonas sp. PAMC 26621]